MSESKTLVRKTETGKIVREHKNSLIARQLLSDNPTYPGPADGYYLHLAKRIPVKVEQVMIDGDHVIIEYNEIEEEKE